MEAGDARFREIYRTHSWEGGSRSGPGSDPGKAAPYLRLLQGFIDDPANRVGSIVDLGCGDWAWTRHVRFGNRRYAGFDVVPEMVQKLTRDHGTDLVRFAVADTDMVLTCLDCGFGTGLFPALHLVHVIPASRLDFPYQLRLACDIGLSYGRLVALREPVSFKRRALALARTGIAFLGINHRGRARRLEVAFHAGYCRGLHSGRKRDP